MPDPFLAFAIAVGQLDRSGLGTAETSFYPTIVTLLDSVGKQLKPRVRCVQNPGSVGAGIPDVGLYTPDQLDSRSTGQIAVRSAPSRGVVEVKPIDNNAWLTAEGEQVTRYWGRYGQVLVTNL